MKLNFVGLTADLINLQIYLPEDKRAKAHRKGEFVCVKDLEKCTGMLNYMCHLAICGSNPVMLYNGYMAIIQQTGPYQIWL